MPYTHPDDYADTFHNATAEEEAAAYAAPAETWNVVAHGQNHHYGIFQILPWRDTECAALRGFMPGFDVAAERERIRRLIAATPDLLAALQEAADALESLPEALMDTAMTAAATNARAAIAKAEGAA